VLEHSGGVQRNVPIYVIEPLHRPIWWITYHSINRSIRQPCHDLQAIAEAQCRIANLKLDVTLAVLKLAVTSTIIVDR
jgi:hypothetical protein